MDTTRTRALVGLILACALAACARPVMLFDLTQLNLDTKDATYPEVLREATLTLDTTAIAPDKVLAIKLPSGETLAFEPIGKKERADGTVVWTASADKKHHETSTFVLSKGILTASIKLDDGRTFRIVHVQGATYKIQQIDRTKIPREACATIQQHPQLKVRTNYQVVQAPAEGMTCPSDDGSQIDLMVVYTPAALAAAAQASSPATSDAVANMEGAIEIAVSETATSYTNSGISQELNLLRPIELVDYEESASVANDLDKLIAGTTSGLAQVHADRNGMAADIVVMVTNHKTNCGLAYTMARLNASEWAEKAFAIVPYRCLFDTLSLAHELGHLMGARHDKFVDATAGAPYIYNHGRVASQPSGNAPHPWLTVMATDVECSHYQIKDCLRIQFWSSPNVTYYEMPTGIANETDNQQTLNNTASTVAKYRCSTSRATSPLLR